MMNIPFRKITQRKTIKKKKEIPEKFIKVLKGETTIVPERRVTLNINDKLQLYHLIN